MIELPHECRIVRFCTCRSFVGGAGKGYGKGMIRLQAMSRFGLTVRRSCLPAALAALLVACRGGELIDLGAAEWHLDQADAYLERGLSDSALAAFGLALEENPQLTGAHMGMGHIYHEHGQYRFASRSYEYAAELEPMSFDAHYYLGVTRQLLGELREAVRAYLQALTIEPDSAEANRELASTFLQMGRAPQAEPYAKRATELAPRNQAAWANLAAAYSLTEQYGKAVRAFREAARLGPLDEPLYLGLADAHLRLGHYDRAVVTLTTLLQQQSSAVAHERLGYAFFKKRDYAESLTHYTQALELAPDDPASLNGVGVCLMAMYLKDGRAAPSMRRDAIDAWQRSLELRPDQPRIARLVKHYADR